MLKRIITYDLRAPGRNYQQLYDAIGKYSPRAKITESCWIVGSDLSVVQIRNGLMQYIDSNDRLFVAALTGEAAWLNAISSDDRVKALLTS
jgi:hypothetical protein